MTNLDQENTPIFILGSPRSGTTFAISLLNRHSKIFGFNEILFYEYIETRKLKSITSQHQLTLLAEHILDRLETRTIDEVKSFGCTISGDISKNIKNKFEEYVSQINLPIKPSEIFNHFMMISAKCTNKSRWAEKTPNHVFYIKQILNDFPNAKFLHISRDPYAYLLSYKFSPYTTKNEIRRGKLYHPIITSILWNNAEKSIDQAKSFLDGTQIKSIRYEDLIDDTPKHLKEICDFFEIDFEEEMHNINGSNSSFKKEKKKLSFQEEAVCSFICRKYIVKNNYTFKASTIVSLMAIIPATLTLPLFFIRAITTHKSKIQGSMTHYILTRLMLKK